MKGEFGSIKQMRTLFIILAVVFVGVGLFALGFNYLYKGSLEKGSCDLCFELNPHYSHCENWEPVNFSKAILNISFNSYENQN